MEIASGVAIDCPSHSSESDGDHPPDGVGKRVTVQLPTPPTTSVPARFDSYAVSDRHGPHVTVQAGIVHLGRHWTTASRRSVKARSIERFGRAAVTTHAGTRWRAIGGPASVLDPSHPSTFVGQPLHSLLAAGAVVRMGLESLDQILGYAQAGSAVPLSFLPSGRVLLVTRIDDELTLDEDEIVRARGSWAEEAPELRTMRWTRSSRLARHLQGLPDEIAGLARRAGEAHIGVSTPRGAVALPAQWDPTGHLRVPRPALAAVGTQLPGAICVTLDDSSSRRPDEKVGLMLRGIGTLIAADEVAATVALQVHQVTHWRGFVTETGSRREGPRHRPGPAAGSCH